MPASGSKRSRLVFGAPIALRIGVQEKQKMINHSAIFLHLNHSAQPALVERVVPCQTL